MRLLIVGTGGHAKVVADAAVAAIEAQALDLRIHGFLDDREDALAPTGGRVLGRIAEGLRAVDPATTRVFVAVGDNVTRERIAAMIPPGAESPPIIHPRAYVAATATVGAGTFVAPGAIVMAGARIGRHVIVNTGASVDHDCEIHDFCHIAPGARLCGSVAVGRLTLVGVGAAVTPGVHIGAGCIIGAGAAVIENLEDGTKAVGVPARRIEVKAGRQRSRECSSGPRHALSGENGAPNARG